ncbi:hypothetical protein, partial [Enterobacter ludwigii]|uniref:hypothetical protein n=1 Tax=Enterobacter ludwigii TaxID=299767 RepID=UPI003ED8832C
MKTRQYAQKSIFDLEAIFEQSRNNVSELEQLLSELTFRNTARARTLTSKIEQSLTALSDRSEVAMSASNPSTCNPDSASIQFSQAECQQRVKSDPLTVTTNGLILIHLVYSG